MIRKTLLVLIVCTFSGISWSEVEISINGAPFVYKEPARLAQVLAPVAFQTNWYWPSSQLFVLSGERTEHIEQKRKTLVDALNKAAILQPGSLAAFTAIIEQLDTWYLADRVIMDIDYDLARVSTSHNPQFADGKHLLILRPRPNYLHVFGALSKAQTIDYPENHCVADILAQFAPLRGADRDKVYIITPSGSIQQASIAYWNKTCVVAPPGAFIYVPLQESQWSTPANMINQQLAELALNRIFTP